MMKMTEATHLQPGQKTKQICQEDPELQNFYNKYLATDGSKRPLNQIIPSKRQTHKRSKKLET